MPTTPTSRAGRIQGFLNEGQAAANAGRWTIAARAWIEAAKLGSLDGANAVSRTAAPHLVPIADNGDVDAQALLAGIMMDYYTPDTLPMAVGYAKSAADAGHAAGLRTYGFMFHRGLGVAQDDRRAAELFVAAAKKGDGYAALNLASFHLNNQIEGASHDECMRLLAQAAKYGIGRAGAVLGDQLAAMDRDEEALAWYLWAAEHGEPRAMFAAGCWYRDGFGTPVDTVQAVRWFLTMLAHGDGDGLHEALELAGTGMTDEEIREAGRLARMPHEAENLINTLAKYRTG